MHSDSASTAASGDRNRRIRPVCSMTTSVSESAPMMHQMQHPRRKCRSERGSRDASDASLGGLSATHGSSRSEGKPRWRPCYGHRVSPVGEGDQSCVWDSCPTLTDIIAVIGFFGIGTYSLEYTTTRQEPEERTRAMLSGAAWDSALASATTRVLGGIARNERTVPGRCDSGSHRPSGCPQPLPRVEPAFDLAGLLDELLASVLPAFERAAFEGVDDFLAAFAIIVLLSGECGQAGPEAMLLHGAGTGWPLGRASRSARWRALVCSSSTPAAGRGRCRRVGLTVSLTTDIAVGVSAACRRKVRRSARRLRSGGCAR